MSLAAHCGSCIRSYYVVRVFAIPRQLSRQPVRWPRSVYLKHAGNGEATMSAAAKGLIDRIIAAGLSPPQKVTIAITNGCNLSCAHCWPDSLVSGIKHPVPLDVVAKLIGELAELGVEGLCITGGEPLAHPAWSEILHLCCTSFRFKEVCLQTNATLLTEDKISVLNSPALKPLLVQVSLDGAISATHAAVRGQGSFERTFHALQMLASAGLGGRTRVAFTEMEHNFDELVPGPTAFSTSGDRFAASGEPSPAT